jgi:hypothetical protein
MDTKEIAAHLDAPDTCGSCRFCARIDMKQGLCRGAPPTPVVVGIARDMLGREGPNIISMFPNVEYKTPACGRYEAKAMPMLGRVS